MSFGLFIILLTVIGITATFIILYFLGRKTGAKVQPIRQPAPSPAPKSRASKSHLQEIEIPKVPMYQKTKEPMTKLKTEIDHLGDIFDIAFAEFQNETGDDPPAAVHDDLKKMHRILEDARKAAGILLATVLDRPIDEIAELKPDQAPQGATDHPPFATSSMRDSLLKTFILLRETIAESKSCIAGFYFALTKKDKAARTAEASRQIALLIALFDSAITRIDSLETTP